MTINERVKKILDLQTEGTRLDSMIVAYMNAIIQLERLKDEAVALEIAIKAKLEAALARGP